MKPKRKTVKIDHKRYVVNEDPSNTSLKNPCEKCILCDAPFCLPNCHLVIGNDNYLTKYTKSR